MIVATAGWSIPRASAAALPRRGSQLERYAKRFPGVEINSSFYRSHARETYARWAASTPAGFRFAVKLPQQITHDQRLRRSRAPLQRFLSEIGGLGRRLGPLLVQLPRSAAFERRVVDRFFATLRDLHDGAVACEPRHPSWFTASAERVFERHRVARVAADPAVVAAAADPAGSRDLVYFRWHGSPRMYWSVYDDPALLLLVARVRAVAARDTWCVFDNTASGGAMRDGLRLLQLTRRRRDRRPR